MGAAPYGAQRMGDFLLGTEGLVKGKRGHLQRPHEALFRKEESGYFVSRRLLSFEERVKRGKGL